MWNHAQNCLPSGDEETTESEPNCPALKDRLEKSLDLTQYLKYLDQLFSIATSESDSSDSEDGEGRHTRTFTAFLPPPAQSLSERCLPPPPYSHNHLILGSSGVSDSIHLNHHFSALRASSDNFHLEANISSSSLSSIDSGTSSLSLNLSTETFSETTLAKAEEAASAVPLNENNSLCAESSNSSAPGTEDDKPDDDSGGSDKKKSQKKKKPSKANNDSLPRQNKPNSGSGGKGNNGSKGGGSGGSGGQSSGGSNGSTDNNSSSNSGGGSTGSNQNMGSGGSPGAKSRSLQAEPSCSESMDCLMSHLDEVDNHLNSVLDSPDALLLNGDVSDDFSNGLSEGVDTFESHGLNAFPITALLDIQEDENSLSDYISMTTPLSVPSTNMSEASSPMSQSSTNFFGKIAAAAASSATSRNIGNTYGGQKDNGSTSGSSGKKRKLEGFLVRGPKFAKLTEKQRQNRIKFLDGQRKKIYVNICRKEIPKKQRTLTNTFKESLVMKKKLAHACSRHLRKTVVQSDKCMKDSICKAKRLTQEMEIHWKLVDRVGRDLARKEEKEAEERLKQDMDLLKQRKQQRKLNEMVTQVELFASKLISQFVCETGNNSMGDDKNDILRKIDEISLDDDGRLVNLDDYDSDQVKTVIRTNTDEALQDHQNLVKLLDMSGLYSPADAHQHAGEISQPELFEGVLNSSQVHGLSWLTNMYCQGLNGIFEEETGLVDNTNTQIIAFMSHLAESYGLWGPFLIVVPAESLQKWQMDVERMAPRFKVVSYWGKPMERKILRQFWDRTCLHMEEASFHVVVTSYQVMVADLKYISKVNWQYLIMDDAQGAITSSTKWMPVLSFRCRTKLLLSSALQLTSLPHLCSYLYFLMPSLFDSQEELSEWLLKELESQTGDNKKSHSQLGEPAKGDEIVIRLRSVVQQFMLDCSNQKLHKDMKPDIDILLYCSPSRRQRQDYTSLLEGADLRRVASNMRTLQPDQMRNRVETVLNLSKQLIKICNHPNLLEDQSNFISSPYWMESSELVIPKLVYEDRTSKSNSIFSIYSANNVHSSLFRGGWHIHDKNNVTKKLNPATSSTWSFARMLRLSCGEVEYLYTKPSWSRLSNLVNFESVLEKIYYDSIWGAEDQGCNNNSLVTFPEHSLYHVLSQSQVLPNLVFATIVPNNYHSWGETKILPIIPETIEYRRLTSEINRNGSVHRRHSLLQFPQFLRGYSEPVLSKGIRSTVNGKGISENRITFPSELLRCIRKEGGSYEAVAGSLTQAISSLILSPLKFPDLDRIIADSCKLQKLDRLLTIMRHNGGHGVLICSYVEGTLEILRKFVEIKRLKCIVLEREGGGRSDPGPAVGYENTVFSVYLLNARRPIENVPNVDTVVFFDQDWDAQLEVQKQRVVSKLEHSTQINCYRLVCRGTIEEKIMKMTKDRSITSMIFCKDALKNLNGSSIPFLQEFVSLLLSETDQTPSYSGLSSSSSAVSEKDIAKHIAHVSKVKSLKPDSTTKSERYTLEDGVENMDAAHDMDNFMDYFNENEDDSDSASPCYSEGPDSNEMDRDGELDINDECQEDRFNFNLDEGYMGMSPDSFEEMTIKSDYEEDSSPNKYRLLRGSGKRGRPPSRRNLMKRDLVDLDPSQMRRGPGRPRLKSVGPLNQGMRGRRPPGRPPLAKKAETISSGMITSPHLNAASHQRVFGFYSSPDLELS